jgi:hypothetical protein
MESATSRAAGTTSTSDRLIFRNTMRINPGEVQAYREAIEAAVAFAEEHAPQVLVDVFIDEEAGTATSFQIYADSEAVLRHWELSDPYIAAVMEHCTVERFEVFGSPSAAVLEGMGATSGVEAAFTPRLTGYAGLHAD